jgi:hypothetical protein
MANDYAALQARIADELNRSDLTSQIALEIASAIRHYERQRFWFNEVRDTSLVTVPNVASIAAPTTMVEGLRLDLNYGTHLYPLEYEAWKDFEDYGGADTGFTPGVPQRYGYFADQFWFLPVPDQAYSLTLSGVERLADLVNGSDSNAWTTDGEELIRMRAKQAVRINYLDHQGAIQQAMTFAEEGYLSPQEKAAHASLLRLSALKRRRGHLHTELSAGQRYARRLLF